MLGIKLKRDVDPSPQSCLRSRCNHRQIPMEKTQRRLQFGDKRQNIAETEFKFYKIVTFCEVMV